PKASKGTGRPRCGIPASEKPTPPMRRLCRARSKWLAPQPLARAVAALRERRGLAAAGLAEAEHGLVGHDGHLLNRRRRVRALGRARTRHIRRRILGFVSHGSLRSRARAAWTPRACLSSSAG